MKPRTLYRIERYTPKIEYIGGMQHVSPAWSVMFSFQYMQKSFADGAWTMLKSFYGNNKRYRLVNDKGDTIDEWCSGEIQVN